MFNLDAMFGQQIDAMRPLAQSAAVELRTYGARVLARLDRIVDAVENEDFDERRIYIEGTKGVLSTTPLGGAPGSEPPMVPAGEEWLIESVTINCAAGASPFRIVSAPVDAGIYSVQQGIGQLQPPLWGGLTASGTNTLPGCDTVIPGNTRLYVVSLLAVDYRVQFKRVRPRKAREVTTGGMQHPSVTGADDVPGEEMYRHSPTWSV